MKPLYIGIDKAVGDDETAIAICEKHGRRMVCRAVIQEGELQDAIMQLAMTGQHVWTGSEIDELNELLDGCTTSVSQWLATLTI